MNPALDERKWPTRGKISPAIPAGSEGAILSVEDPSLWLGGRLFLITGNGVHVVAVSPHVVEAQLD